MAISLIGCRLESMFFERVRGYRACPSLVTRLSACLLIACLVVCVPAPQSLFMEASTVAYAATWPLDGPQGSVSLGFAETYSYQGKTCAHSGVDVSASKGAEIVAPEYGRVSFVGRVPSGDSGVGKEGSESTMTAVSILMDNGKTLTLMPFERVDVSKGDAVSEGAVLGLLAGSGDRSSDATHLHMGLKRNGVYYNPLTLFGVVADEASAAATTLSEKIEPLEESKAVPPSAELQTFRETAGEASQAIQLAPDASVEEAPSFGSISSGENTVYSPMEEGQSSQAGAHDCFAQLGAACAFQVEGLCSTLSELAGISNLAARAILLAAVLLAVLVLAFVVGRLVLVIRQDDPSGKEKETSPLCGPFGGDSMHKLFPAPGTSFITRGRLAQRR